MDSIEKSIADIEHQIANHFNKGEIDDILTFFSDNFVGFSSTHHKLINKKTDLKATFLHYLHEGDKLQYSISDLDVRIYGEAASCSFYWKVVITKNKRKKTINGRGSHLFLQDIDGWQIVHEHYSKTH